MRLYIANKRYSSWSLRVWLGMKTAGIPFGEEQIFLRKPDTDKKIDRVVRGARLPILEDGAIRIWESMAIFEYLAEKYPRKRLWPSDRRERALARAYSNEMHASFMGLRKNCPMNCFARPMTETPAAARADVRRILEIWNDCLRRKKKGGFLFGNFSVADAMYAPVVIRLKTYGLAVDKVSADYMERVLALPAMKQWFEEAAGEEERIAEYENIS